MISKVLSSTVFGIDAYLVEVDIASGFPQFSTVGLPEGAVRESKERVKAAIKNCGYNFPLKRITVNLAPADRRKEGSAFDVSIAIGILAATGIVKTDKLNEYNWGAFSGWQGKTCKRCTCLNHMCQRLRAQRDSTSQGKCRKGCGG